jgi:hypothetical protein
MTEPMTTLTATKTPSNVWKVAYDGLILGDDRGFATEELCEQEITKRLAKDAREAVILRPPPFVSSGDGTMLARWPNGLFDEVAS